MSLGRELNDFVNSYYKGVHLSNEAERTRAMAEYYRRRGGGFDDGFDPDEAMRKKYGYGGGKSGGGILNWIGRQFGIGGSSPTDMRTPPFVPEGSMAMADTYSRGGPVRAVPYMEGGGVVPDDEDLPPDADVGRLAPGGNEMAPPAPAPAPAPIRQAVPVAAPRQALTDQTRTAAFDPVADANDPDNAHVVDDTGRMNAQMGPTQQPDQGSDDVLGKALKGGMDYARHIFHLDDSGVAVGQDPRRGDGVRALTSGIGAADPQHVQQIDDIVHQVSADPSKLTGPLAESIYGIRRLELIYQHYVQTGQTDKANKAAFELIQYSAGQAAKYGDMALGQLRQGDVPGAVNSIVQGYNQIPNGHHVVISKDGRTAVIQDQNGQPVQQIQFTAKDLFNYALGLKNRSLYWQQLEQRVQMTAKGQGKQQTPLQEEKTRAEIENLRARTARVKRLSNGSGGGEAVPQAILDQLDDIEAKRVPRSGTSGTEPNPAPTAQRPQGSDDDGDGDPDPDADPDAGRGVQPAGAGGEGDSLPPAGAPLPGELHTDPKIAPPAVNGVRPLAPGEFVKNPDGSWSSEISMTVTNPKLNGGRPTNVPSLWLINGKPVRVDEDQAAQFAANSGLNFPSYDDVKAADKAAADREAQWQDMDPEKASSVAPLWTAKSQAPAPQRPGMPPVSGDQVARPPGTTTPTPDPDTVPNVILHDGKALPPPKEASEVQFTDPNPLEPFGGRNPYMAMLTNPKNAAYFATKAGRALKSRLLASSRDIERDVADWKRNRTAAQKEFDDARKAQHAADVAEVRRNNEIDLSRNPSTLMEVVSNIKGALGQEPPMPADDAKGEAADKARVEAKAFREKTGIGLNIFTMNRNTPVEQVAAYTKELLRAGDQPDEKDLRSFTPVGKDVTGAVIVQMNADPTIKLRLKESTFHKINRMVESQWKANVAATEKKTSNRGLIDKALDAGKDVVSELPHYLSTLEGVPGVKVSNPTGRPGAVSLAIKGATLPARAFEAGAEAGRRVRRAIDDKKRGAVDVGSFVGTVGH